MAGKSVSNVVIGSGPSGYAAMRALLARGAPVTVIDAGVEPEPASEALRAALPEDAAVLRSAHARIPGDIGRYGSAHAVRQQDDLVDPGADVVLRSSHALGGLSNVWGSAVLPWAASDIAGWPVTDLAEHYRAVSEFLPIAGAQAGYDDLLGTPDLSFAPPLPGTGQGARLLSRLAKADGQTIRSGPARQAVEPGCRSCGLCLYGCPWGLIFTSAAPVSEMRAEGRIDYVKGRVARMEETSDGVTLTLETGETIDAVRVFVAAGVLETARIVFASRPALSELTLRESRHFFTPFLHAGAAGRPDTEPHHTLVLAFVEMNDRTISPHLIHTQIYGWNDFYAPEMGASHGRGLPLGPLFRWLSRRLFAAQTFLHSDHCTTIRLRPSGERLAAEPVEPPGFHATVARTRAALAGHFREAGLHAVGRAGRLDPPGASFHTGGTLPMNASPGPDRTDTLGRPDGATRIHIVDASVLPAIPATTITFPVMANAHRIASLAPLDPA